MKFLVAFDKRWEGFHPNLKDRPRRCCWYHGKIYGTATDLLYIRFNGTLFVFDDGNVDTCGSFYYENIMRCNFQKSSCYFLAINLLLGLNVYICWSSSILKKPKCKESDASSLPGATPTVLWLCILCRIEMWGMGNESRLFLWWALVRKFQRSPCTFRGCSTHASRAHQTTPTYPYCRQGRKSFSSGCFRRQQWGNSWYQSWA